MLTAIPKAYILSVVRQIFSCSFITYISKIKIEHKQLKETYSKAAIESTMDQQVKGIPGIPKRRGESVGLTAYLL